MERGARIKVKGSGGKERGTESRGGDNKLMGQEDERIRSEGERLRR